MERFAKFETFLTAITGFYFRSLYFLASIFWIVALVGVWLTAWAGDFDEAERLYTDHCAVCHGADRGAYIGPALNSDETNLT